MKFTRYLAITLTAAVLGVVPAVAAANGKGSAPGQTKSTQSNTPTPKGKAYGKDCSTSTYPKKHVAGTPGTPFSACVHGAEQAAKHPKQNPAKDCPTATYPKKHYAHGLKGSPYSACVSGAAKQLASQH